MFSEKELTYLKSQPLARIGIASNPGRPDVTAIRFDADGEYIYVSGRDVTNTMKYRNVLENPRASFVIDDLKTTKLCARAGLRYKEKRTSSSIRDTWDPEPISGSSLS